MFYIPGWLIALVTFPGVIAHEAAHRFFCDVCGIRVLDACYFRLGNPSGYVTHEATTRLGPAFLITAGPLIVNTILCSLLTLTPVIAISLGRIHPDPFFYVLFWVGLSVGVHAFPSNQDTANFVRAVNAAGARGPLVWLAKGFRGLLMLANLGRIVWFDMFYALAISCVLPGLLLHSVTFSSLMAALP